MVSSSSPEGNPTVNHQFHRQDTRGSFPLTSPGRRGWPCSGSGCALQSLSSSEKWSKWSRGAKKILVVLGDVGGHSRCSELSLHPWSMISMFIGFLSNFWEAGRLTLNHYTFGHEPQCMSIKFCTCCCFKFQQFSFFTHLCAS